jgi:hypothetical protein
MWTEDTFELSPRAIRFTPSRLNGVLFGYDGSVASSGTETSMSFMETSAAAACAGYGAKSADDNTAPKCADAPEVLCGEGFDLAGIGRL